MYLVMNIYTENINIKIKIIVIITYNALIKPPPYVNPLLKYPDIKTDEIIINNTINLNCDTINMSLNSNFLVILCENNLIKYYDYKNKRFHEFTKNVDVSANLVKIDTYPLYHGRTDLYYGLTDKGTIKYWTIKQ